MPKEQKSLNPVSHDGRDVLKLRRQGRNFKVVHQLEDGVESEEGEHGHVLQVHV